METGYSFGKWYLSVISIYFEQVLSAENARTDWSCFVVYLFAETVDVVKGNVLHSVIGELELWKQSF